MTERVLDLYIEDFENTSVWEAVCQSVGVEPNQTAHIEIIYKDKRAFDQKGDEI